MVEHGKEILTERADLFDPNMTIAFSFDIVHNNLKYDEIETAVKRAFAGFEMTLSKIVLSATGKAFYSMLKNSNCLVEETNKDFFDLIVENEKRAFDIAQGETMRVFIKITVGGASVLILSHHLAGDGKSITYFIDRVMKNLAKKNTCEQITESKILNKEDFPKDSELPFITKQYAKILNRKWKKSKVQYSFEDRKNLHNSYWNKRQSVILKEKLTEQEVKNLKANAASIGVTLNSLLLTSFLKHNSRYKGVGMAVSVRQKEDRSMSNEASGITAEYSYNHNLSFERNAKLLHEKIYKRLNKNWRKFFILQFILKLSPTLIDAMLMASGGLCENKAANKLAKALGYLQIEANSDLSVTNLTQLDICGAYGDFQIANLFFIPPVVSYSYQTVGIATLNGCLSITLHSLSDRINESEKQSFYNAVSFLKNSCEN